MCDVMMLRHGTRSKAETESIVFAGSIVTDCSRQLTQLRHRTHWFAGKHLQPI
jgi:hypothetical protein